jgi:hypothetical protein
MTASTPSSSSGPHQHVAGLGALRRPDDAAALHEVHQPAGLGEAHAQLALEHRRRAELRRDHQLDGLAQHVEVVADVLVDLALALRARRDVGAERRLALGLDVLDDGGDLGVGDERALHAQRLARAHRQEQAVALADQLLAPAGRG